MAQTKRERFVRVAEARTQKVLDDLHSLSKCAATASYEYSQEDVTKIMTAVEAALQEVRDSFAGRNRFTLEKGLKTSLDEQISDAAGRAEGGSSSSLLRETERGR